MAAGPRPPSASHGRMPPSPGYSRSASNSRGAGYSRSPRPHQGRAPGARQAGRWTHGPEGEWTDHEPGRLPPRLASGGPGPRPGSEAVDRSRSLRRVAIYTLVILLVLVPTLYFFVIPRVEVNLRTFYAETYGPSINVDCMVENFGTVDVTDIRLTVTVLYLNETVAANKTYREDRLESFQNSNFANIHFFGDQIADYHILIFLTFRAGGKNYASNYSYTTAEYMNIVYDEKVG